MLYKIFKEIFREIVEEIFREVFCAVKISNRILSTVSVKFFTEETLPQEIDENSYRNS